MGWILIGEIGEARATETQVECSEQSLGSIGDTVTKQKVELGYASYMGQNAKDLESGVEEAGFCLPGGASSDFWVGKTQNTCSRR